MDFDDGQMDSVPSRPMRVKILYTFDSSNTTNCLARIPDVLSVPAVDVDVSTQIGIIELRQCLQAVVSASPELISGLNEGDFTIYAYDYSEQDTPLVGHGALSAALAAPSEHINKTRITGRVCKNVMALFNNGVKETLEVKLRLAPVPKAAKNEYTKSMENYRSQISAVSVGPDQHAWIPPTQQTNAQLNEYFNLEALASGGDRDMSLVDEIFSFGSDSSGSGGSGHRMTGGVGIARTPTDSFSASNPAFPALPHSAPGSRAGSPIIGPESSMFNSSLRHQSLTAHSSDVADYSRPASRASTRSETRPSPHKRQASMPSLAHEQQRHQHLPQQTDVFYNDEGTARKRAKVTQADWRGRSFFGSKSSDLRVTAATAASMQMHRPIPRRHATPGSSLDPPPRVPTPVPQSHTMVQNQQQQPSERRSLLRQTSTAESDFMSDAETFSVAVMSSPDESSPGNSSNADVTPQEIPSSPPVFPDVDLPQPSSPGLPTLPLSKHVDSGYMSERGFNSSNNIDSLGPNEYLSPGLQDSNQLQPTASNESQAVRRDSSQVHPRPSNISMDDQATVNRSSLLPTVDPTGQLAGASQAPTPQAMSQGQTSAEAPSSRRGSLALPPKPLESIAASSARPPLNKGQSSQRARSSWGDSEAGSPAPSDTEGGGKPRGHNRSGGGAQRRKIIEQRLKESLERGETPQFCHHCGAIETPTWRKIYVKKCEGRPTPLDSVEAEGETVAVEVTETDETTGEPAKFVIRKTMKKTKDFQPGRGFEDRMVCNPCGLWFNKFKAMRPSDKWGRRSGPRRSKKRQPGEPMTDSVEPQSDLFEFTDPWLPGDNGDDPDFAEGQLDGTAVRSMPAPIGRPRANSLQSGQPRRGSVERQSQQAPGSTNWRDVQSSPVHFRGSEETPIQIEDLTPKPTRRLLFPSPRREGETKSLDSATILPGDKSSPSKRSVPPKTGLDITFSSADANVFEAFTYDKENIAPTPNLQNDDLAHLFGDSPNMMFKTPTKTPSKNTTTPKSLRQLSHLLKTPTPSRSKRKPLTPNANAANNAKVNDFMTSPSSSRYFLRSTPSRLERTPGSSNRSGNEHGMTPWSRHLAQMLSDPNAPSTFASPNRNLDFSDLPTFTTPGRGLHDCDWDNLEGILSSDFAAYEAEHGAGQSSSESAGASADGTGDSDH